VRGSSSTGRGGNWRYSFRGGEGRSTLVTTGDAGPSSYTEADAFFNAFVICYGYEPDDSDFPPGVLEAYDEMNSGDDAPQNPPSKSNYPPVDRDPYNRY
jgi:hypothetical protein